MPNASNDVPLANVQFAANFADDLKSLEACWRKNGVADGYQNLLDELGHVVVSNLQRHPTIGVPFADRALDSVEAESLSRSIAFRMSALPDNAQLREYAMDEYLVLYAHFRNRANSPGVVHMLGIMPK